jgi:hypothetical protein
VTRERLGVVAVSLALAAAALVPGSASAGSLLSGYGGPGEGNQVILGAALLGGPSGGAGAGGEGGSGSGGQGSALVAPGQGAAAGPGTTGASGAAAGRGRHSHARANAASGNAGEPSAQGQRTPTSPVNIDVSKSEVLPSSDLQYILLALVALAATGAMTRRLAREPRRRMQGR